MRFADTRSSFVFEPLAIAASTSRCSSLDAAHMNLGDIKGTAFSCRIRKSILNIDSHLARYRPARIRLSPARAQNFSDLVAAVASSAGHGEDAAPYEGHGRQPERESGRGPLDHYLQQPLPGGLLKDRPAPWPDTSCNHGFPEGTFRAAGCKPLRPRTCHAFGDSHPVPERVDCTRRCRMSPAERAFCPHHVPYGAARPVRAGQERADRVQIGDKGSERTHTDERKPHDSAVHIDGQGVPTALCHQFGHSGPRSPSMHCQCALPSSTRSTPAMMSAMPATMVRVSGSPKRYLEAIAVTATPPADQIP